MKLIESASADAYSKLRNVLLSINPNTANSIKLVDFCSFFSYNVIEDFASWLAKEYDLEPEDL